MLNHILEPTLLKHKFDIYRADQISKAGFITTQIINMIIDSDLVIADLSESNPNVFYELAIRHASGKPYIQIASKGEKIPFDISGIRSIFIDLSDLDSVEKARQDIENQIVEFDKGHKADSPISVATTTRLIQEDTNLAEKIAERLADWGFGDSGYIVEAPNSDKIESIYKRLYGFNDWSSISMEDTSSKLDEIYNKVKDL